MNYPEHFHPDNKELNYTKVCFSALRRVPKSTRLILSEAGRWDDVAAWAYVAALEAWRKGLGANDAYNLAQRLVYGALKALGLRVLTRGGKRQWTDNERAIGDFEARPDLN